jgi:hypothetical protein
MATLVVDGVGSGVAVDGSGKAAWRLAIFSAHTGSRLTLSSSRSMRRLPASPNQLVRRLAASSADSSMEAYPDLCRAASKPACTAASIEEASWDFQSMERRGEGGGDGTLFASILNLWRNFGWNFGDFRGGIDWL